MFPGVVKLIPGHGALCFVNGQAVSGHKVLRTGSRVILGKNHVFRYNHPERARERVEEIQVRVTYYLQL